MIVIDSDDEDGKHERLAEFMPSHLISEMDLFRDSFANAKDPEVNEYEQLFVCK